MYNTDNTTHILVESTPLGKRYSVSHMGEEVLYSYLETTAITAYNKYKGPAVACSVHTRGLFYKHPYGPAVLCVVGTSDLRD